MMVCPLIPSGLKYCLFSGSYIKEKKLQDPENKQYFKPDTTMEPVFGKDKVRAFGMARFLKTHLTA